MRASFLCLVGVFILSFGVHANAQVSFTTNLTVGSRGAQVVALQQMLNKDPDTRIANTGHGSSGNETDYFGSLTRSAVIRFQEKYASEVLAPAGLSQGSGYVGLYTKIKLNSLSIQKKDVVNVPSTPPPTATPPSTVLPPTPATTSQNPNLKNVDRFLTAIDKVGAQQGLSVEKLALVKAQVIKEIATTTDLRAMFLKQVEYAPRVSATNDSFGNKMLATIEQAFNTIFMPKKARAATGVPFGGALLDAFYCSQSQTWLITLEPLPPSYAVLLTYIPFSQAFLSYNIPITNWLLGEYEPGAGVCVAGACPYCVTIPSEGMISPMTGSSPT
ncbi:MAG: peptidoglycan-binding protein [Patescibacteria group bacterium]|nr:peptidoglycan-binding protein [Patescibacteria group bacterium]